MGISDKVFATDFGAWVEDPPAWVAGVFGGVGGLIGSAVVSAVEPPYPSVVVGLVAGATVLLGFGFLALID